MPHRLFSFSLSACLASLLGWFVFLFSPAPVPAQEASASADIVLHNGKVVTVDSNFSTAKAVAIRRREFSAVGQNEEMLALAGPGTLVIDLKGRTVLPGLIDTHRHMYSYAERAYGGGFTPEQLHQYPVDWRGI